MCIKTSTIAGTVASSVAINILVLVILLTVAIACCRQKHSQNKDSNTHNPAELQIKPIPSTSVSREWPENFIGTTTTTFGVESGFVQNRDSAYQSDENSLNSY